VSDELPIETMLLTDPTTGEVKTFEEVLVDAASVGRRRICEGPPLCLSHRDIVAAFAREAVALSPYDVPVGLETALQKLADATREYFYGGNKFSQMHGIRDDVARQWLVETLERLVEVIPEVAAWSVRRNGRDGMGFSSMMDLYCPRNPDDDFVDLGALSRNVAVGLFRSYDEQRRRDAEWDAAAVVPMDVQDALARANAPIYNQLPEPTGDDN
jgi:hypothetical protein